MRRLAFAYHTGEIGDPGGGREAPLGFWRIAAGLPAGIKLQPIEQLLKSSIDEVRAEAAGLLGWVPTYYSTHADALLQVLNDPEIGVAYQVVQAVIAAGHPRDRAALMGGLERSIAAS